MSDVAPDEHLRTLMVRYQAGDAEAFDQLYVALGPLLRRYLIALARDAQRADDLLQDTFLQLHRSRRTYNPSRPVRPWAFAVARHMWLMDQRTRRRKAPPHQDLDTAPELPVPPEAEGLAPLLRRVRFETGCSILIIEHDMPLISAVADELIALDQGRFVTRGRPADVLEDERVVESYLGATEEAVNRSGSIT